ncbi:MAG TPA: hypothetical protein VLV32_00495 [Burkholderiales bacterium]|nr:hypothetical protein [Burkholderiales bacterium]
MNGKIILSWTGGMKSVLMLHRLLEQGEHEVLALVAAIAAGESKGRIGDVPRALLETQACALGFPLYIYDVPSGADDAVRQRIFGGLMLRLKRRNVNSVAFGGIFAEDMRAFAESLSNKYGIQCLFPLWKSDSRALASEFMELGFKGVAVGVDGRTLDASFAGREIDSEFFRELPGKVDPCGENSEFTSFIYDGPLFKDRLRFAKGAVTQQGGFYYCNMIEA